MISATFVVFKDVFVSIVYSCLILSFSVKKRRERDSDTTRPDKYRFEGTIAGFEKLSKGTEPTKSLYLKKKLWEDEKDKIGNFVSSANTDKVQYFSRANSIL
jgi:hypothetical protein